MDVETIIQQVHVLKMSDEEVDGFIDQPEELVAMLMNLRPSSRLTSVEKGKIVKSVKAARAKGERKAKRMVASASGKQELFACRQGCDRVFKFSGYRDRHEAKWHSNEEK